MASLRNNKQETLTHNTFPIIKKKQLNFNHKLTLTDLCLRKILVCLWSNNEMLISIENFQFDEDFSDSFDDFRKYWRESIEVKLKYNISKLALPETLKKMLLSLIRPMGSDLLRWKIFHEPFIYKSNEYFDKPILEQIQWTGFGVIDHVKTAERLIRLEMFNLQNRYRLACLYCLEDKIRVLWEQLPERRKWYFHGGHDLFRIRDMQLEYYWPYVLKGEESELSCIDNTSFNKHAFECSARRGNKTISEYFFNKLTDEERDAAISSALDAVMYRYGGVVTNWPDAHVEVRLGDVLFYLLSLMSPEQQEQLLKKHPCAILNCFHDWPWHEVFLDLADVIWTFLPEDKYDDLLRIVRNSGYYFPNLFQKFFARSPIGFKKYFVIRESYFSEFFLEIFHDEDTETVKAVLASLDLECRMKLVSSYSFFKLLNVLMNANSMNVVQTSLLEASFDKENRDKVKEAYMGYLARNNAPDVLSVKPKWERVFEFLDETEWNAHEKRRSADETLPGDKKACGGEEQKVLPEN